MHYSNILHVWNVTTGKLCDALVTHNVVTGTDILLSGPLAY